MTLLCVFLGQNIGNLGFKLGLQGVQLLLFSLKMN